MASHRPTPFPLFVRIRFGFEAASAMLERRTPNAAQSDSAFLVDNHALAEAISGDRRIVDGEGRLMLKGRRSRDAKAQGVAKVGFA